MTLIRSLASFLALLGLLALAAGCSAKKISDRDLVFVDPVEASDLVAGRSRLIPIGESKHGQFIDVRLLADYRAEHLPGAIHLDLADLDRAQRLLADFDPIIVYGDGYDGTVANAMSKSLMEAGVKNVHTLRGGIRGWKAAGLAVEP